MYSKALKKGELHFTTLSDMLKSFHGMTSPHMDWVIGSVGVIGCVVSIGFAVFDKFFS